MGLDDLEVLSRGQVAVLRDDSRGQNGQHRILELAVTPEVAGSSPVAPV